MGSGNHRIRQYHRFQPNRADRLLGSDASLGSTEWSRAPAGTVRQGKQEPPDLGRSHSGSNLSVRRTSRPTTTKWPSDPVPSRESDFPMMAYAERQRATGGLAASHPVRSGALAGHPPVAPRISEDSREQEFIPEREVPETRAERRAPLRGWPEGIVVRRLPRERSGREQPAQRKPRRGQGPRWARPKEPRPERQGRRPVEVQGPILGDRDARGFPDRPGRVRGAGLRKEQQPCRR